MGESANGSDLTPHEQRTLAGVLDELIPPRPDGSLPGAGALGLARHLEDAMGRHPELAAAIRAGLAGLDAHARRVGRAGFAELAHAERIEALRAVTAAQPGFLPGLLFHSYVGYYRDDRVLEALGLEARPPFPKGFPLEPGDLSRLDAVRRRPRMYRDC